MALALSFRQKLLAPTLVAVATMLLAVGASYLLIRRASGELDAVERAHLPALRLAERVEAGVAARQRLLQDAAAAEDVTLLEVADAKQAELAALLAEAPPEVLPPARRDALAEALELYARRSREATRGLASGSADPAVAEQVQGMARAYGALTARLGDDTEAARGEVSRALERTRALQQRSIVLAALLLGAAALAAIGLALALARSVIRPVEALNRVALRIAEGDLTEDVPTDGKDEIGALAASFGRMSERLRAVVSTLQEASVALGAASARLSEHTRAQVGIVERAAAGVAETGVTTRELEHTASLAASRAAAVLEVARRATEVSRTGHAAAEGSAEGIRDIQAAVERIAKGAESLLAEAGVASDVVETVRELAARSHVLSINASLEATRAGEAGKGFGVVATEVRALAEQSGAGADRIARIVKGIQAAVRTTLELTSEGTRGVEGSAARIRASGDSLRDLGGIVAETGGAAQEIAGAVQQQSAGIAQIATAMRDLDDGMIDTVKRLEAVQQSADELAETSRMIAAIAGEFRVAGPQA